MVHSCFETIANTGRHDRIHWRAPSGHPFSDRPNPWPLVTAPPVDGTDVKIMDIIRARACKHSEVRTYEGVVFSQATCVDCGDITIASNDFISRVR